MPKLIERILLIISDLVTINLSFFFWVQLRDELGYSSFLSLADLIVVSGIICLAWFLLFLFFGLYRSWYAQSRFDEFISLFKTITLGVVLIFLATLDIQQDIENPVQISRIMIVSYWLLLLGTVSFGRMSLRTLQRKLLEHGIGQRNSVIIGSGKKAIELFERVKEYPALGHKILGLVPLRRQDDYSKPAIPVLGEVENLETILVENQIEEVIIALETEERTKAFDVIGACNGLKVNLKIVPDLYDIVVGQARTNQIYGFPLIEIFPELMPQWERRVKRLFDILFSGFVLSVFSPLWLLVALAIKLDSRGSVFYVQERVGRNSKLFHVYKFRSMVRDAESISGPVWADKNDPRITRVGKIVRKLRIDEIPQLLNVLKGDMSLVGPRPERPYFVERLKMEIPYYTRRFRVRPGITGWAQIKHQYDQSFDDVRKKIQYDLYYIENMSLRMDLKIILNTIYIMLAGKGH